MQMESSSAHFRTKGLSNSRCYGGGKCRRIADGDYPSPVNSMRTKVVAIATSLLVLMFAPGIASADPPGGGDAPGTQTGASTSTPTGTHTASLSSTSDHDWYRVAVPLLNRVTITITPDCSLGTNNPWVDLVTGSGRVEANGHATGCAKQTVSCTANDNLLMYFHVYSNAGSGSYSISAATSAAALPPLDFCTI